MDVKKKIEEIVNKIKADPNLLEEFKKDPEKTIEKLLCVDIPDEVAQQVITGVKAALASDKLSGVTDKIKNLF
ncbi:MAG: hypothetical protein IJ648_00625 [Lachnospiraceae bacterium]|nr:hypothetical protein [Lachnospiraceae bacterium]